MIPKQRLLQQVAPSTNHQMIQNLSELVDKLNTFPTLTRKDYLDKSVYFGEIDSVTQKRSGLGVYLYSQGDIYFGDWEQNNLTSGNYIFRNG